MNIKTFIILLVVFMGINSCRIAEDYKQMSHREWLLSRKYNVGQSTILLIDKKRNRPLKTELWFPTNDTSRANISIEYPFKLPPTSKEAEIIQGKFPLILLSHGTGGNRISQMWLACELAGSGYVVASVDHFGNTFDNKIPENFVKVWDRPLDISFLLDQLLSSSVWSSKIDTAKIGMVGFSLGGYTAIALAGSTIDYKLLESFSKTNEGKIEFNVPELGDLSKLINEDVINDGNKQYRNLKEKRITAFVALSPAMGQGFKYESQFENVNSNILIIGAQNDERTPPKTNAKHYHQMIKNSRYIELEGKVGHYIFMNAAKSDLRKDAPIIFKDDASVNRIEVHKNVSKTILDFFTTELK